jgi:PAS domain S-box-containing protein
MASPDQIGSAEIGSPHEIDLRRIVNLAPQMLAVMEPDGRFSWVNEVVIDYLGFTLADVSADELRPRVFHPDDVERIAEERRNPLARGIPFETEQRMRGKDGKYRWFLTRYKPLKDAEGRVLRWYGAAIDIEDRKRAEEAARRSEKELRDVIEIMPAMAWSALPDGSNAFVTGQWTEYTGLSAEQTSGSGWQTTVHPEDLSGHIEEWRRSLATGLQFEHETRLRRAADRQYRWFLVRGMPLRHEQGNILKWCGIATDIEDRKRAEQALQAAMSERTRLAIEMPNHCLGRELQLQASAGMYTRLDGSHSRIRVGETQNRSHCSRKKTASHQRCSKRSASQRQGLGAAGKHGLIRRLPTGCGGSSGGRYGHVFTETAS